MAAGDQPPNTHICTCPYCPIKKSGYWITPAAYETCTCSGPLLMVIPPEGIWISCPVHGMVHIPGSGITLKTSE